MATISTSILTNDRINMQDPNLVRFGGLRELVASPTNFSWDASGFLSNHADVDIEGSNFTYSGDGDTRELAGGTISKISIDYEDNNGGSETQGDLVITGTEGLVASNIDKDDAYTFCTKC